MSAADRFGPPTVPLSDLKSYDIDEYAAWLINRSTAPSLLEATGPTSGEALRQWKSKTSSPRSPTQTKKRAIRPSELTWFKPDLYDRERLDHLGPAGWTPILSFRLLLRQIFLHGPPAEALEGFGFIQDHPIDIPFWEVGQLPKDHFSDHASVQFARAAPVADAVIRVLKHNLDGHSPVSPALAELETRSGMEAALLQVDLTASRAQIRKDFNSWLKEIDRLQVQPLRRDYSSKGKVYLEWRNSKYLECFDLDLFAELNGAVIPPRLMADVLGLGVSRHGASHKDEVKVCRTCHDVFTWETVIAMARQRDAEAMARAKPVSTTKSLARTPRARRQIG